MMSNFRGSNSYASDRIYIRTSLIGLRRDDIMSHFSAFGEVKNLKIKNKRGLSSVEFADAESAANTSEIDVHTIGGRRVEIFTACDPYDINADDTTITTTSTTTFSDLNDYCIHGILSTSCLTIIDLCSVAEVCPHLKDIAGRVVRTHKTCNLLAIRGVETEERILKNFGSVISELQIRGDQHWQVKLDAVTRYCSNTLESLYLQDFHVSEHFIAQLKPILKNLQKFTIRNCNFIGAGETLFADCKSLITLDIVSKGSSFVIENSYPKLEQFKWWCTVGANLDSFVTRHKNLTVLKIGNYKQGSSLLPVIVDNCERLEELKLCIQQQSTVDLSNLRHLTKLTINCDGRNVLIQGLLSVKSLKLKRMEIDLEFNRILSKLNGLQVLRLKECKGLDNLGLKNSFDQLTTLKIKSFDWNFDIVRVIERLQNVKFLSVNVEHFFLDIDTYFVIVGVVRQRTDKAKLIFQILNYSIDLLPDLRAYHARHKGTVQIVP